MDIPKLSILTVNFGSSDQIKKLWESLQKFPPSGEWEWVVVDNPMQQGGDGEMLADFFEKKEQVHVVQLATNLGYGGGNAEGARFCRGEFLAILNPDTQVLAGTLDVLIDVLRREKNVGVVVPVLRTENGQILENARKFPTLGGLVRRRLFGSQILTMVPDSGTREINWAQGSFWVLRRELFEKLGGFDPRFFLFLEDTDFCRRVWESGQRVLQVSGSVAIHSPNRLSGGNIFHALRRKTFWIHLQSAVLYFKKWAGRSRTR